jgi:catechol 2,3-dioxygenase-like lactoylglutathione lyase family enzyme
MDNVGIVVEDIDAAVEFFTELGLTLEGRMPIEGEWAGRATGVRGQRVEITMMCTPDGHSRLELSRFDAPAIASDHRTAPVNLLGYLRVMFTVEDLDDTLPGSASSVRRWSMKSSITKTSTGSATSAVPKEFSSGSPNSSGGRPPARITWNVSVENSGVGV